MFEHVKITEKAQLSAKVRSDLLDEIKRLRDFVQEVEGSEKVTQSDVVEHIVASYFQSSKKEVQQFRKWKKGEWPETDEDSKESYGEGKRGGRKEKASKEEGVEQEPETGEIRMGQGG